MRADRIEKLLNKIMALVPSEGEDFTQIEKDILLRRIGDLYEQVLELPLEFGEPKTTTTRREDQSIDRQRNERRPFFDNVNKILHSPQTEQKSPQSGSFQKKKDEAVFKQPVAEQDQLNYDGGKEPGMSSLGAGTKESNDVHESTSPEIASSAVAITQQILSKQVEEKAQQRSMPKRELHSAPFTSTKNSSDFLFKDDDVKDLSEQLGGTAVSDIYHTYSIHEKIHHIQELFGGDHTLFNRTIAELNSLNSLKEARRYLEEKVIQQQKWLTSEKKGLAHQFVQKIKRRYR